MEAGQPFPRAGVDFRKWFVEAYKDWLRDKLGAMGGFVRNRKLTSFLVGLAIVMIMWSGDLSWLQTLRGYVPQYVLDAIVIVQLGDETLAILNDAVGQPVPAPLAGAMVEVGHRRGAIRRQNRDAVFARNQVGAVGNAARIAIRGASYDRSVRAAAGSIAGSVSLSGMLGVSACLVTSKLVHDYNRNYQPQRVRAWLRENTPEFNHMEGQAVGCVGDAITNMKSTRGCVFAVNRPPDEDPPPNPQQNAVRGP